AVRRYEGRRQCRGGPGRRDWLPGCPGRGLDRRGARRGVGAAPGTARDGRARRVEDSRAGAGEPRRGFRRHIVRPHTAVGLTSGYRTGGFGRMTRGLVSVIIPTYNRADYV